MAGLHRCRTSDDDLSMRSARVERDPNREERLLWQEDQPGRLDDEALPEL